MDQNGWQGLARVDVNISDNTKLFLRYNLQREVAALRDRAVVAQRRAAGPLPLGIEGRNRSDSGTVSLTHVFNPTLTNETIFAVTYINFPNVFKNPEKISGRPSGIPTRGSSGRATTRSPR